MEKICLTEAVNFVKSLWRAYLVDWDINLFEQYLCDDVSIIGTGSEEVFHDKSAFMQYLKEDVMPWAIRFLIDDEQYMVVVSDENNCVVYGSIRTIQENQSDLMLMMDSRFTAVLIYQKDHWYLKHLHHSSADYLQENGEIYPSRYIEQTNEFLAQQLKQYEDIYSRDELTRLYKRGYTENKINALIKDFPHKGLLIMLDIDNFKYINDTYGHLVGDGVLTKSGEILLNAFRLEDVKCRLGGDEFVVFLNGTNLNQSIIRQLDKLREQFQNLFSPYNNDGILVSISMGIAEVPKDGENFLELYHKADEALYYIKKRGKNNYMTYQQLLELEQ